MHQGTSDVGFIVSKEKFPTALRSYLLRNQGRVASLLAQVILPVDDGRGGTADISGGEYARLEIEIVGAR
eukprot:6190119-Pleurochrysis_carterae.AAC.1